MAMFDGLQNKLQEVFRNLRGEGRISEEVLAGALRQIRLALLEADVHIRVVKPFVERIRERALGAEVMESLSPAQQVVKIVRDELALLLGDEGKELQLTSRPSIVLLCGLQGSGKTTTAGKLAKRLVGKGRHPILVAGDLQRAAAVEQLQQVGKIAGVPVVAPEPGEDVFQLAERAIRVAKDRGNDVVIIDTAGRLHIDQALMAEIGQLAARFPPDEALFVADSMTGQDAVKSAEQFAAVVPLTGAILTKLDGDSRGGAALSIRTVAKVPIRMVGTGEKADDLELFHPERMASRMIGMGDVLSLIERAEKGIDVEEAKRLAERAVSAEFSLEDLRDQLRQMRKLGPLASVLEMLPKMGPLRDLDASKIDEGGLVRIEAMINSMTPQERRRPDVINGSRKLRIAKGSGTSVQEINRLLKQHKMMKKMMKGVQGKFMRRAMGMKGKMR